MAARDRMGELQKAGIQRPRTYYNSNTQSATGIEMNNMGGGSDTLDVGGFLDDIANVDQTLRRIQQDMDYVDRLHREGFDAYTEQQRQRATHDLDRATSEAKRQLAKVRAALQSLEQELGSTPTTKADFDMALAQLQKLKNKYEKARQEFFELEVRHSRRQKERMAREIRIAKPNVSEEEIEDMISNPQATQVFAQEILHSTRYGAARNALKDVQDRQDEILKLERTIEELADLFLDLNTLIEQQQIHINQIEAHVDSAVVDLEKGDQEVAKAVEYRKSSIRWSWYLCACIIIIIIAIAVYLFAFGPLKYLVSGKSDNKDSSSSAPAPSTTHALSSTSHTGTF
ncbi:hypothetical protein RI367_000772 [Sorochytrium milnesiophthora]